MAGLSSKGQRLLAYCAFASNWNRSRLTPNDKVYAAARGEQDQRYDRADNKRRHTPEPVVEENKHLSFTPPYRRVGSLPGQLL